MQRTVNEARNEGGSVTEALPGRRRQLITLMKVYEQADPYYRAALRPIIKTVIGEET